MQIIFDAKDRLLLAISEKRNALRCGKANIWEFYSHGLHGAKRDRDKIHQPKLQVAGAFGSSFGLHMTGFGAYSLNVLHSGAPKFWTVIKPADHRKIELQLHADVEESSLRGRRIKFIRLSSVESEGRTYAKNQKKLESLPCDFPPRCDQFLNHQPFYIPKGSLEATEVEFTNLVQYEGELVITFPFAYRQGYSCGPSVGEEVGHTNERSEILNQEGLYQHCHHACTGPKLPFDFDAFPSAEALDAWNKERTIQPVVPKIPINYGPTASTNPNVERPPGNDAPTTDPSLDPNKPNDEVEGGEENESGGKRGKRDGKRGRRRRLVRASELPGYR